MERHQDSFVRCEAHHHSRTLDIMMRETNHRIANSLQAVMALSATTAGGEIGCRHQLMARVSAVANVHRLLSRTSASGTIDFGDYLDELSLELRMLWSDGPGTRSITSFHSGGQVSPAAAMRLGMIVNELVTNACKFAYGRCQGGEIRVGFSIEEGLFTLLVVDDGRGLKNADPDRGSGRRLLDEIAHELRADLGYHEGHPGTIAILTGPADALLHVEGDASEPMVRVLEPYRSSGEAGGFARRTE